MSSYDPYREMSIDVQVEYWLLERGKCDKIKK
jgi:hypothetical protein